MRFAVTGRLHLIAKPDALIATVAVLLSAALLVLDRFPRFYQGDSIAYLSTGMSGWIPPDRSWAYGFGSRWLVESVGSVSALPVAQAIVILAAILVLARTFAPGKRQHIAALSFITIAVLDPLTQTFARFWLSDTVAGAAFLIFVAMTGVLASGTSRRKSAIVLLIGATIASVFIRVAYVPIELGTLLIALLSACLMARRERAPGLRRTLLALLVLPVCAAGGLAFANSLVAMPTLRGQIFLNRMSGLYTMGVFLPGLRYQDFQRAGVEMTPQEFDGLHLDNYDERAAQIWGEQPRYVRFFLQRRLNRPNVYDADFQKTCSSILRSAILHHPQTLIVAYLHITMMYLDPAEWVGGAKHELGLDRPLPDWVARYLSSVSGKTVLTNSTAHNSLLPEIYTAAIGGYPLLLLAGNMAALMVLVRTRPFGIRHVLAAAVLSSFLAAPLYSHAIIPRYLVATVTLSELLLCLTINDFVIRIRPTRRHAIIASSSR